MSKLKEKFSSQHVAELKRENETLKREKAELTENNNKLKQSLDELVKSSSKQLSETRKQLLDVCERLTVAEQVTEATRRRELQQEATDNVSEKLQPTEPPHVYAKLRPLTGIVAYRLLHM